MPMKAAPVMRIASYTKHLSDPDSKSKTTANHAKGREHIDRQL